MSSVIIHTNVFSPFGWTARLTAAEKGVPHEVGPADVTSPEWRSLHPFGKMPVLRHGDVVVYETLAIAHYLDSAFAGPALQPSDPLGQTTVLRWISVSNNYAFPVMNGLMKERSAAAWRSEPPDEAAIQAMRAPLAQQLELIGQAVTPGGFVVGDRFTLADAFLFPLTHFVSFTPEGAQALAAAPAVARWLDRMRARPAVEATNPMAAA